MMPPSRHSRYDGLFSPPKLRNIGRCQPHVLGFAPPLVNPLMAPGAGGGAPPGSSRDDMAGWTLVRKKRSWLELSGFDSNQIKLPVWF
eukprot:CAMPEP_0180359044 /NCGR_PEP_ID=MMETSP0989-20121125/10979_1 /TAXON_ID=697907 /ORGANISM="non described non described, Strain CCMP2293" /LENGTH=87 /DNA_ID=CAMNT_0022349781 /DNA_START=290 /DNA_END=551 /DNA_ORIENTATION=+